MQSRYFQRGSLRSFFKDLLSMSFQVVNFSLGSQKWIFVLHGIAAIQQIEAQNHAVHIYQYTFSEY